MYGLVPFSQLDKSDLKKAAPSVKYYDQDFNEGNDAKQLCTGIAKKTMKTQLNRIDLIIVQQEDFSHKFKQI